MTTTETMASFDRDVSRMVRSRESQFNEVRAKFIKETEVNPVSAITWGSSVMIAQYEYLGWQKLQKHLDRVGADSSDGGVVYETRLQAVEAVIESLTDCLMAGLGGGQSTCLLSREAHRCQQVGTKYAIDSMRQYLTN
jgi:hypothetical protein